MSHFSEEKDQSHSHAWSACCGYTLLGTVATWTLTTVLKGGLPPRWKIEAYRDPVTILRLLSL